MHRQIGKPNAQRQGGFTLVEIMITVAIAAVLAGIAVPNLSSFLRSVKLNSISNSLGSSLNQARSEAITRNTGVVMCAANAAKTGCATTLTTNYVTNGWLVCYDSDNNSTCDTSTTALPNPIRVEPKLDATFATVVGPAAAIRFAPSGALSSSAATITITGTWTGGTALTVTVAASGLIKAGRVTNSSSL